MRHTAYAKFVINLLIVTHIVMYKMQHVDFLYNFTTVY